MVDSGEEKQLNIKKKIKGNTGAFSTDFAKIEKQAKISTRILVLVSQ